MLHLPRDGSHRNVLMYLNAETQERVLERFSFALRDDGILLLGKAEMLLSQSDLLLPIDLRNRLFTKRIGAVPGQPRAARQQDTAAMDPVAQMAFVHAPEPRFAVDLEGRLALVNEAAVGRLGIAREDLGHPFQDLPISYRPVDLRGPIASVRECRWCP